MPMLGPDTNKKNVAALILARVKPGGKTEDVGVSGGDKPPGAPISEGERAAAEEMISAFHDRDVEGLVSAFKSMMDVVEPAEDDESSPEQEESKPGFIG